MNPFKLIILTILSALMYAIYYAGETDADFKAESRILMVATMTFTIIVIMSWMF